MSQSPVWRKSRTCEASTCVEAAVIGDHIALRDSKDPDGPILRFDRGEWNMLLTRLRAGDFQV